MSEFRTRNWVARSVVLLVALLFAVPFVSAQVTTGNLQGVVKDPTGAVVAGAAVKVTNAETGIVKETTTNDEGFFRVTNLLPGDTYVVEVTASGFGAAKREQVPVRLGLENNADIQLAVAGAAENVTVTGDTPLIQANQSQLSQAYTPQQLTQLPFNGSIDNLALLTPGVVTPGDSDFANGVGISANGNRGRSNNFQIDGQDNNDNSVTGPSLSITNGEAIGEFQVITNTFSAEFGRNSGAQINTITKSGTNEFHGTLFEYHQNSVLNARDNLEKKDQQAFAFLTNAGFTQFGGFAERLKGPNTFRDNRFGGAIGGPIKSNKAFFFVTYQGEYFRGESIGSNATSASMTPNLDGALALGRLFPNAATAQLTCADIGCGPAAVQGAGVLLIAPPTVDLNGDSIPDEFQFSPTGPFFPGQPATPGFLQPLAVVLDESLGVGARRVIFGGEGVRLFPSNSTNHQVIGRVDYNLTSKDTIVGRYIFDNSDFPLASGGVISGSLVDVPSDNNNLGITYTRTISSRFVNEARFNFSRLNVSFGDTNTQYGPSITFSQANQVPFANLATGFGVGNTFPQSRKVDVYQYQDTVSATLGNHSLRFGADIRQQKVENFFLPNINGTYQFRATAANCLTAIPGSPGQNCTLPAGRFFSYGGPNGTTGPGRTAANAFENFILGRPSVINFALGNPRIKTDQNDFFFFVQDDWRVRPNLTLNLGLRYEISTQPLNPIIEQVNAREADPARAIFNQSFPLSTRTATELPLDKNNIAPRIGFAYSPNLTFLGERFTNGRTVIRGNFGIAYDPGFFNIILNTVTAAPYAAVGTIQQNTTANPGFSVLFPFLPTTTAQLNTTPGTAGGDPRLFNQTRVAPDFHNPYAMSFGFGIQQEVFRNSVFEARYVGTRLVGQFQSINDNPNIRFLNIAGQTLFGDPGRFTHGVLPGTCSAQGCVTPTAANGFQNRPTITGQPANPLNNVAYASNGRVDPLQGPARNRINGASSTYHGMQLRFDTRFIESLTLNMNYSLSKTLDNASEIFATFGGGQSIAFSQDPFNTTSGERGLSAFHQKHNFTANFLYDLPFYKEQRGAIGKLLGGYQINGIIRLGSGRAYTPVTITGDYDSAFDAAFSGGAGPLRPFYGNPNAPVGTIAFGFAAFCQLLFGTESLCDPSVNPSAAVPGDFIVLDTLNPGSVGTVVHGATAAASALAATQQARLIFNDFGFFARGNVASTATLEAFNYFKTPFGDVGRNTFSGLPFYSVNMSVFKTTNITENTKLEFRVEAFNLLNRRNFGVPDAFTEDAHNGFAVSSFQNPGFNNGGNRSLRFGLRFIF
jgi:outer membrane receptor protein involved in Fe transport